MSKLYPETWQESRQEYLDGQLPGVIEGRNDALEGMRQTETEANKATAAQQLLPETPDPQQYDYAKRHIDHNEQGTPETQASLYENKHVKPGKRNVYGYDVATQQKVFTGLDTPSLRVSTLLEDAVTDINEGRINTIDQTPDERGFRGLSKAAYAARESGQSYTMFLRDMQSLGYQNGVVGAAYNAASRAKNAEVVANWMTREPTGQEWREARRNTRTDYTGEMLAKDQTWLDAARVIYQGQLGEDPGEMSDDQLNDYLLQEAANFNWNVFGMADMSVRAAGDEQFAQAMLTMLEMYDKTSIDTDVVRRSFTTAALDPLNYLGLGGGAVMALAARKVALGRFKDFLAKTAARRVATTAGTAGATFAGEASVFGAADNVARQSVAVSAGEQEGVEGGQVAKAAALSGVVGFGLGVFGGGALAPETIQLYRRMGRNWIDSSMHVPGGPVSQRGMVGTKEPPTDVPMEGPFRSQMRDVVEQKMGGKRSANLLRKDLEQWAEKGDIKPDELNWSDIDTRLEELGDKKLTKDEVLQMLDDEKFTIERRYYGGGDEPDPDLDITFGDETIPGLDDWPYLSERADDEWYNWWSDREYMSSDEHVEVMDKIRPKLLSDIEQGPLKAHFDTLVQMFDDEGAGGIELSSIRALRKDVQRLVDAGDGFEGNFDSKLENVLASAKAATERTLASGRRDDEIAGGIALKRSDENYYDLLGFNEERARADATDTMYDADFADELYKLDAYEDELQDLMDDELMERARSYEQEYGDRRIEATDADGDSIGTIDFNEEYGTYRVFGADGYEISDDVRNLDDARQALIERAEPRSGEVEFTGNLVPGDTPTGRPIEWTGYNLGGSNMGDEVDIVMRVPQETMDLHNQPAGSSNRWSNAHFDGEDNSLVHIRQSDYDTPEGQIRFLHEIQSDLVSDANKARVSYLDEMVKETGLPDDVVRDLTPADVGYRGTDELISKGMPDRVQEFADEVARGEEMIATLEARMKELKPHSSRADWGERKDLTESIKGIHRQIELSNKKQSLAMPIKDLEAKIVRLKDEGIESVKQHVMDYFEKKKIWTSDATDKAAEINRRSFDVFDMFGNDMEPLSFDDGNDIQAELLQYVRSNFSKNERLALRHNHTKYLDARTIQDARSEWYTGGINTPHVPYKKRFYEPALKYSLWKSLNDDMDYMAWPSTREQVMKIEHWNDGQADRHGGKIIERATKTQRDFMSKFLRKYKVRPELIEMDVGGRTETVWAVPLKGPKSGKLRAGAAKGFPIFQLGTAVAAGAALKQEGEDATTTH